MHGEAQQVVHWKEREMRRPGVKFQPPPPSHLNFISMPLFVKWQFYLMDGEKNLYKSICKGEKAVNMNLVL